MALCSLFSLLMADQMVLPIAGEDRMFLGMQDFDFVQFQSLLLKIYLSFTQIYSNLPKFRLNCPNLINFTQENLCQGMQLSQIFLLYWISTFYLIIASDVIFIKVYCKGCIRMHAILVYVAPLYRTFHILFP